MIENTAPILREIKKILEEIRDKLNDKD